MPRRGWPFLLAIKREWIVAGLVFGALAGAWAVFQWIQNLPEMDEAAIKAGEQLARSGREGILACTTCHGEQGQGDGVKLTPRLAGLNPEYLFKQLEDFARDPVQTRVALDPIARDFSKTPRVNVPLTVYTPGTRYDVAMNQIARALSQNEKRNLAVYFASLPFTAVPLARDFETLQRGEDLALRGKPEFGLPACVACHGPDGEGYGAVFPPLAGQPPEYLIHQIDKWQRGTRDNDPMGLMKNVANQLTDADKYTTAAYFANLSHEASGN